MSTPDKPPTVHPVSALASLIQRVRQEAADAGGRLSYRKIADRSDDLNPTEVHEWATQPLGDSYISLVKRRGLAIALRRHPIEVDQAVAESLDFWLESFGYDYRTDPALGRPERQQIEDFIGWIKEAKGQGRRNA